MGDKNPKNKEKQKKRATEKKLAATHKQAKSVEES